MISNQVQRPDDLSECALGIMIFCKYTTLHATVFYLISPGLLCVSELFLYTQ